MGSNLASAIAFLIWGGADVSDTCAHITGVGAAHWAQHRAPCDDLVERRALAIGAGILLAGATYGFLLCTGSMCLRFTIVDPLCGVFRSFGSGSGGGCGGPRRNIGPDPEGG